MSKGKTHILTGMISLLLILMLLLPATAFAAGAIDTDRAVSLRIDYQDGDTAISGARFDLYRVADVDRYARMTLTQEFEGYPIDFDDADQDSWQEMALTLKGYAKRDKLIPFVSGETDKDGILTFAESGDQPLMPGLYLVVGSRRSIGDDVYSAMPFMLFLPGMDESANEWDYAVSVSPKHEKEFNPSDDPDDRVITRKVIKVWDDEGYETIRPENVTVQLLCDGEIYDTVVLSQDNNWRYAWDHLSPDHEWLVVEKEIRNYAVTVSQTNSVFFVSNKYVVPITSVDPPIQKKITGDRPAEAAEFTFIMTAKNENTPMPEGSHDGVKTVTLKGAGSTEFGEIVFTEPGTYSYTIGEKDMGTAGYTYDTEVYTVTYEVTQENGELSIHRTMTDHTGAEIRVIEFNNVYRTPGEKLPQTGLLWWPVPVLAVAGLTLLLLGCVYRKENHDEENS